ncbi:MAG: ATP synthase F1 subunit gamma [Bacteroidota bacterium]
MANLRDIRTRISSVNNTIQITKAMKMVAAAKLRKAQNRMIETRPYASKLSEVTGRLAAGNRQASRGLFRQSEEQDRVLFIVIGSDRGLCGGFNNNLFKVIEERLNSDFSNELAEGRLDLYCLGKKANAYFRKRDYQVVQSWPGFFDQLNFDSTAAIMQQVREQFLDEVYDAVYMAFNEFKSIIAQERTIKQILPVNPEELTSSDSSSDQTEYLYEPDTETILDQLLPLHLTMQLWGAVLESNAAEQGARMAAMDNATENAKELEQELRLTYNQARQSAITTEISEIVSGAQALEGS